MGIAGSRGDAFILCYRTALFRSICLVIPLLIAAEARAQTLPATTRATSRPRSHDAGRHHRPFAR